MTYKFMRCLLSILGIRNRPWVIQFLKRKDLIFYLRVLYRNRMFLFCEKIPVYIFSFNLSSAIVLLPRGIFWLEIENPINNLTYHPSAWLLFVSQPPVSSRRRLEVYWWRAHRTDLHCIDMNSRWDWERNPFLDIFRLLIKVLTEGCNVEAPLEIISPFILLVFSHLTTIKYYRAYIVIW
jgi:hypothetical protein